MVMGYQKKKVRCLCWTALLFVSDVCAGQLFCLCLNQTNSLAIFKRQPFYLELDPNKAIQTKKKEEVAGGRGKRKE